MFANWLLGSASATPFRIEEKDSADSVVAEPSWFMLAANAVG